MDKRIVIVMGLIVIVIGLTLTLPDAAAIDALRAFGIMFGIGLFVAALAAPRRKAE